MTVKRRFKRAIWLFLFCKIFNFVNARFAVLPLFKGEYINKDQVPFVWMIYRILGMANNDILGSGAKTLIIAINL
ncbi:hypothetical protein [Peribacillus butanolivorans]|uniref:hypothetical protein n=1 Tax=Peribacillus butanolivorans TaxID=421767 RepID=UPI0036DDACDD